MSHILLEFISTNPKLVTSASSEPIIDEQILTHLFYSNFNHIDEVIDSRIIKPHLWKVPNKS